MSLSSAGFSSTAHRRAGITLRELEVLRALVATGKTTAAAHRLGVSQPAVSRALAQLETRLDRLLFRRDGGRLVPTAEAIAIDSELEAVFAAIARIGEHAGQRAVMPAVLRVAAPPTIAHRFLPRHIAGFARAQPQVRVSLDVVSSDVLVTQVAEARVDIGISDTEPSHGGVHVEPFRSSDAVCLVPEDHPLAARAEIVPADLDGAPFIALTRRHSARIAIDRVLAEAGVQPRIVIETSTSVSASEFVREGLGLTLLNPFPVAARLTGVAVRPFRPAVRFSAAFLLASGQPPTPATLAFMAHVRSQPDDTPARAAAPETDHAQPAHP